MTESKLPSPAQIILNSASTTNKYSPFDDEIISQYSPEILLSYLDKMELDNENVKFPGWIYYWYGKSYTKQFETTGYGNRDKIIDYYKKSIELNNSYAMFNLAKFYLIHNAQYYKINTPEAIELLDRAVELKNPFAMSELAVGFLGLDRKLNQKEKLELLFESYELGNYKVLETIRVTIFNPPSNGGITLEDNLPEFTRFSLQGFKRKDAKIQGWLIKNPELMLSLFINAGDRIQELEETNKDLLKLNSQDISDVIKNITAKYLYQAEN